MSDGVSEEMTVPLRDRERWPHRRRVQRMARAELARRHGAEYRRLLAKYTRALMEGEDVHSGQQDV